MLPVGEANSSCYRPDAARARVCRPLRDLISDVTLRRGNDNIPAEIER